MKLSCAVLIPAIIVSFAAVAQDASQAERDRIQIQQSTQGERSIISDPAGSQRQDPQGRGLSDRPPGRAFSVTNPPPGRPFQEGGRPPGRAFQERGLSDPAQEPAGTERSTELNVEQQQIQDPAGAQQQPGQQPPLQQQQPGQQPSLQQQQQPGAQIGVQQQQEIQTQQQIQTGEPAGAQRGDAQQIANALGSIRTGANVNVEQNVQLKQAIKTSIKGNVPDEFVDRLSRDLSMALTKVQVNQTVQMQIAEALNTVLTAAPTSHAQVEQAITTIQSTLIQNGVARPQARAVACDLHLIATELVPNLQLAIPAVP